MVPIIIKFGLITIICRSCEEHRFRMKAPKMAGTESKNEKRPANSWSIPNINPVEIVIPDREMPGITAIPCIKPIIVESLIFVCKMVFLLLLAKLFVNQRNDPDNKSIKPTKIVELKKNS